LDRAGTLGELGRERAKCDGFLAHNSCTEYEPVSHARMQGIGSGYAKASADYYQQVAVGAFSGATSAV